MASVAAALSKVGEGFMRPNYEGQPITLQYTKLLDWLVDRKKCVGDWAPRANTIQDRVAAAVETLPKDDATISSILNTGTSLNYFSCVRIHARVRQLAGATSMLGAYTSEAVKDWAQILRAYEKDGIYLAEVAAEIQRAGMYEIPALKKQIASNQQQLKDLTRKDADYRASAAAAKVKFQALCNEWSIEGNDVHSELRATTEQLPALLDAAAALVSSSEFQALLAYYRDFLSFIKAADRGEQFLPTLTYVAAHGNTSLAKFLGLPEEEATVSVVDSAPIEVPVDMPADISVAAVDDDAPVEINWDADPIEEGDGAGINWDVDITADAVANLDLDDSSLEPVIEIATVGQLAPSTLLDSDEHRTIYLTELAELRAFVLQRHAELSKQMADAVSITMMRNAPPSVQRESPALLKSYETILASATTAMTGEPTSRLLQVRSSEAYVERLAAKLEQTRSTINGMQARIATNQQRRVTLTEQIPSLNAKIDEATARARDLIASLEEALTKLYNGRPVNIVGDIMA